MLSIQELRKIGRARLKDAQVLFRARRYDGAAYLCGYALELTLKARICVTLKWPGFPESAKEFDSKKSLKTHDLDTLLAFSGREAAIKNRNLSDWSMVIKWDPEARYKAVGSVLRPEAAAMIQSTESLMKVL